ncbi:MAG: hypothetical protein WAL59_07890, partial [Roseiarcus sp.]
MRSRQFDERRIRQQGANSSHAGHNVSVFAGVGRQRHQKGRNDMVKATTILRRTMLGGAVLLALGLGLQ